MKDAELEIFLGQRRCQCCRRPLKANAIRSYCKRLPCQRKALLEDEQFREYIHSNNNAWHKKKAELDPEWAAKRREAKRLRSAARRAALKSEE